MSLLTSISELTFILSWCVLCGIHLQETLVDDIEEHENTDPQASIFPFFSIACVCTPCDFTVWMQADGSKALDKRPIEDKVGEKMWWFLTSNQHVLVFVVRFIVLEGDFRHDWRGVCGVCWGLPTPVGGHTASIVFFILASRMSRACYNSGVSQWCWLEVRLGRWGGFILLLMVSATVWIMS